jgi:hypothetical protein
MVLAAAGGCGPKQPMTSEVTSVGGGPFADSPLLAFVPADTPYAFASFKPIPMEFLRAMADRFGSIARKGWNEGMEESDPEAARRVQEWAKTFDLEHMENSGFSAQARFVVYGLGAYPVVRLEIANGDRLVEAWKRFAKQGTVPEPTLRAGRRYWIIPAGTTSGLVVIGPKELVVAFAPRKVIDRNLATLVGEQPAAGHLTTAAFRELAVRDGFTGQGVGFVDLARVAAMGAEADGATPACKSAIAAVVNRAPRLVFGFEDFTAHRLGFGLALEVAPDVLPDVRGVATTLVGYDRMVARKPAMALAVALDVEHGRALLSRIAGGLRSLGEGCRQPRILVGANRMAELAQTPLPPMFAGLHGGFFALNELKMGDGELPKTIDGYGVMQGDHIDEIVKLASSQVPGLKLATDGAAHALPAMIPYPGHVAATRQALGVALGNNSAATVAELVKAKPAPAPLLLVQVDYRRLSELIDAMEKESQDEDTRAVLAALGTATVTWEIGERGPAFRMSLELR